MRVALNEWLTQEDFRFNFYCTANFNCPTNTVTARTNLNKLAYRTNCKILKRSMEYSIPSERILFIAIPEHPDSNLHYHMVMRAPVMPFRAIKIAKKQWKKIVPAGELWTDMIADRDELECITRYITKDCWKGAGVEDFIISE